MRAILAVAGAMLALQAPAAIACGYCVEDKIAATYDHAVVTRALGRGHSVAFFHVDADPAGGAGARRDLESAANSTAGIDRGSVRVSEDALTLSFAFDPERARLFKLQSALERKLAARKVSLLPLRTMDRPATRP